MDVSHVSDMSQQFEHTGSTQDMTSLVRPLRTRVALGDVTESFNGNISFNRTIGGGRTNVNAQPSGFMRLKNERISGTDKCSGGKTRRRQQRDLSLRSRNARDGDCRRHTRG